MKCDIKSCKWNELGFCNFTNIDTELFKVRWFQNMPIIVCTKFEKEPIIKIVKT